MFKIMYRLTDTEIARFDSLEDALGALQRSSIPHRFYITNKA